jgi:hypothetical protein
MLNYEGGDKEDVAHTVFLPVFIIASKSTDVIGWQPAILNLL